MHQGMSLNIYFAGSIRGGRQDARLYSRLVAFLGLYGKVLTAHVGNETLLEEERDLDEQEIFERDMEWLQAADCLIAEVSTPSLGVGYEIALARTLGKKVLCLFRSGSGRCLSAMIAGDPLLRVTHYGNAEEAENIISQWMEPITKTLRQVRGQN